MEDKLFEEIKELVCSYCGLPENPNRETRLCEDVGMDGDDADEFIIEFSQKFEVDMEGYDFSNYFATEGFGLLWCLISWFGSLLGITEYKEREFNTLTLGNLEQAAKAKKWKVLL